MHKIQCQKASTGTGQKSAFKNFKSYSVTVDSLSKWSIALDINYIPTLIYVKNREIQKRRTGVVKLETIINEKEGN